MGVTKVNVQEATELRLAGWTLDELGTRYGVTRERIRQLVPVTAEQARVGRHREYQVTMDANREQILGRFREGVSPEDIAEPLMVPPGSVRTWIQKNASQHDRLIRRQHSRSGDHDLGYSDAELDEAIQAAAQAYGRTPSIRFYIEWHKSHQERPCSATIVNRRRGWANACRLAGLTPNHRGRRVYDRRWSNEDLLECVKQCCRELGRVVSANQYEIWAAGHEDRPSLALVRMRLGGWRRVLVPLTTEGYE